MLIAVSGFSQSAYKELEYHSKQPNHGEKIDFLDAHL